MLRRSQFRQITNSFVKCFYAFAHNLQIFSLYLSKSLSDKSLHYLLVNKRINVRQWQFKFIKLFFNLMWTWFFLSSDNKRVFFGVLKHEKYNENFLFIYVVKILKVFNLAIYIYLFLFVSFLFVSQCFNPLLLWIWTSFDLKAQNIFV